LICWYGHENLNAIIVHLFFALYYLYSWSNFTSLVVFFLLFQCGLNRDYNMAEVDGRKPDPVGVGSADAAIFRGPCANVKASSFCKDCHKYAAMTTTESCCCVPARASSPASLISSTGSSGHTHWPTHRLRRSCMSYLLNTQEESRSSSNSEWTDSECSIHVAYRDSVYWYDRLSWLLCGLTFPLLFHRPTHYRVLSHCIMVVHYIYIWLLTI